ncbi:MAG: T9SS type A sorting domain-containing protein [Bacteroidetes bacterium]|nr:T9SS type A sorting domain-containing protein [Bacteroidota bacterium]
MFLILCAGLGGIMGLTILSALTFTSGGFCQSSLQFLSATIGAGSYDILYYNNHVYTGAGNTLMIFNLNPDNTPNQNVFEYRFTSIIDDMKIKGTKLFVAANHAGLSMWDASDPASPVLLDAYIPDSLNESAYNMAFYGDTIFLAYKKKMALFYDNGTSLTLLNRFAYQPGNTLIRGCAIKDTLLAFTASMGANAEKGVYIYNAKTLAQVSIYPQPYCNPENVVFGKNNNLLHVLGGTASYNNPFDASGLFYSLDIDTPSLPVEVYRDTLPGIAGLAIAQPMNADNVNDTIFIATQCALDTNFNIFQDTGAGMIYVYDATDPQNVSFLTTINAGLWFFDIDVEGNRIYVASEWYGIKTIDITDIHNDLNMGNTLTGGWNAGCDKFNNTLAVANEGYGFKIFDITDMQNPVLQTVNQAPGFCMNLKYSNDGNYLYGFYVTYDGFRVFDASTYSLTGSMADNVGDKDVWVYQDKVISLAIPTIGDKKLFVTDVSNPALPFVDTSIIVNNIKDIMVNSTGKIFVAKKDTLSVLDLNNNLSTLVSIYPPSTFWNDFVAMAEYKDTLYVYVTGAFNSGLYKYYYNGSNQLTQIGSPVSISVAYPDKLLMAADSFGLYVSDINLGLYAYDKNTLAQTGYYRHGMEFVVNFLWGPQELRCKDNLLFLSEYFGQVTVLSGDSNFLVSTKENSDTKGNYFYLFPNPADNKTTVHFDFEHPQYLSICITDVLGRKIIQIAGRHVNEGEQEVEINAEDLTDGLYFLSIRTEQLNKTEKIIVQKDY